MISTPSPSSIVATPEQMRDLSIDKKLADSANIVIGPSVRDQWVHLIIFVFLMVFMVVGSLRFPWLVQQVNLNLPPGYDITFNVSLLALFPLISIAFIAHRLFDERYILTPEYILEISGRCSLKFHSARLRYIHVKDVEIDKKLYQRFLNVGDLIVATSITSGDSNIRMKGIVNPWEIKKIVQERTRSAIFDRKESSLTGSELTSTDNV